MVEVDTWTLAEPGWAKRGAFPERGASISGYSFPRNKITFYIIPINTLFLFYIRDINKLGVKLNNLKNILI